MPVRKANLPMKPRARLMLLLGEQLIRDETIAVFELVKNAYDADATHVDIILENVKEIDVNRKLVIVEDNGQGMDWETVTKVWLEPGTEHRKKQRESKFPLSPRFNRLPLGEKGIGRFAAHRIGQEIKMITRKAGSQEIVVAINWDDFEKDEYLSEIGVNVIERPALYFKGRKTGTRIEIRRVRGEWTRGKIRSLKRSINSICSPFDDSEGFTPNLILNPDEGELEGLLDISEALEIAPFRARVYLDKRRMIYDYNFGTEGLDKLVERRSVHIEDNIPFSKDVGTQDLDTLGIGPIRLDLYVYDRSPTILRLITSDIRGLTELLNNNGGIRVYRDAIRVYDYGEPRNDWLNLGDRRVNFPGSTINNKIVMGAVSLMSGKSRQLKEKTNREGFIDNSAYSVFCDVVLNAVKQIEAERNKDKLRIRKADRKASDDSVIKEIEEIRRELLARKINSNIAKMLTNLSDEYSKTLDLLLTTSGAGISLFVLVHELDRLLKELRNAIRRGLDKRALKKTAEELTSLLTGMRYLVQRRDITEESVDELITRALSMYEFRFRNDNIIVTNGILERNDPAFPLKCNHAQIILVLTNLLDNSIYWVNVKNPLKKRIYIGTYISEDNRPTIVVADNGRGFIDEPEAMIQPFFTRKKEGTGLGLYIADQVMQRHNGRLLFPSRGDAGLPSDYDGAIIALEFDSRG